ncbi:MAG: L,D-transpeptidase YcbB [Variibacter sp.]|nr:L,D-transpeptidase YcbB [Variibacter sp.]
MRGQRFDGVAAGALLVLALAWNSSQGFAQQPSIDSLVPVPEAADVPPPSMADLRGGLTEHQVNAAEKAQAEPTVTGSIAPPEKAPAEAAAIPAAASEPVATAVVQPVAPVAPVAATPEAEAPKASAALPDSEILQRIPTPEIANVAPPTIRDIGQVPLARLSEADTAVAEKLRDLVTTKLDRFVDRNSKKERAAVEEFYKNRLYAPVAIENGKPNARMSAAVTRIRAADSDGLSAADYPMPDPKSLGSDAEALASAELKLLAGAMNYARHAMGGRTNPSRISTNIEFTPPTPEPAAVLAKLADAKDVAKALDEFNPQHDGFRALRTKLGELRGTKVDDQAIPIPAGKTLKKGMKDSRVPLLRERLHVDRSAEDTTFDAKVADAVKQFQQQKGLGATGTLTPGTVDALNGKGNSREINTIISNMERWRWLPSELGKAYVMVNIPDFTLKVMNNDTVAWRTKIVVGKPNTPSPSFVGKIETIQVNPTWHVPQSIIYNEYLPALQQDPTVLSRMGLVMGRAADGSISIRQPPGERNALGRIKFNFPNRFQVYLHDTPDKHLFAHDRRAYSHGCMRVLDPTMFGEVLSGIGQPNNNERYTSDRFKRMFGSGEQWLRFKNQIPVYLTYLNAYVDDAGKLVVREDIYGYDGRVQSALRGEYMQVAERSQRVAGAGSNVSSGGASNGNRTQVRRARRMVQEQPQRGGFFFGLFQ